MLNSLSKAEARRVLEIMCRGKHVTVLDPVPPAPLSPHTGKLVPNVEQFSDRYLAEIQGDQVMVPVFDDDGFHTAEAPIARKRGQEWRDEIELQESGEIVGYWAS